MTSRIPGPLALALLLGFAGCGQSFQFNPDECQVDADCGEGQRCVEAFLGNDCVTPCDCDSECEGDERCTTPMSLSLRDPELTVCSSSCRGDGDCPGAEICIASRCDEGCRAHEDCPAGEACALGLECEPGCRTDSECADGNVCESAECRAGCRESADCAGGDVCVRLGEEPGTCGEGCESDTDCAGAESCVCGRCAEVCESDADCASGQSCPVAVDACYARQCRGQSDVECGGARCPELLGGVEAEFQPCCLEGDEPRCGFSGSIGLGECGELIVAGGDGGCGEGRCRLDDGRCGHVVASMRPTSAARLCVPDPPAADPACVPAD